MHDRLSTRTGATALLVIAGLLGALLIAAPAAPAATIDACLKKKGGTIRIVASKTKCRKTEKRIRWNTSGPGGANGINGVNGISGTNGINGANGANGTAGQPQKAFPFSVQSILGAVTPIVTIGDLSLRMVCGPYAVANPLDIEATAPSGSTANTGMTITRSDAEQTPPDPGTPQRRIHNANVTTNTNIVTLTTNSAVDLSGNRGNLGHVTGTITTPTQVVLLTANIKAQEAGPSACSVRGSAFGIPR